MLLSLLLLGASSDIEIRQVRDIVVIGLISLVHLGDDGVADTFDLLLLFNHLLRRILTSEQ